VLVHPRRIRQGLRNATIASLEKLQAARFLRRESFLALYPGVVARRERRHLAALQEAFHRCAEGGHGACRRVEHLRAELALERLRVRRGAQLAHHRVEAAVAHLARIEQRVAHQVRHVVGAAVGEQAAEGRRGRRIVVLVEEQARHVGHVQHGRHVAHADEVGPGAQCHAEARAVVAGERLLRIVAAGAAGAGRFRQARVEKCLASQRRARRSGRERPGDARHGRQLRGGADARHVGGGAGRRHAKQYQQAGADMLSQQGNPPCRTKSC
jgi:hypothetical protein